MGIKYWGQTNLCVASPTDCIKITRSHYIMSRTHRTFQNFWDRVDSVRAAYALHKGYIKQKKITELLLATIRCWCVGLNLPAGVGSAPTLLLPVDYYIHHLAYVWTLRPSHWNIQNLTASLDSSVRNPRHGSLFPECQCSDRARSLSDSDNYVYTKHM